MVPLECLLRCGYALFEQLALAYAVYLCIALRIALRIALLVAFCVALRIALLVTLRIALLVTFCVALRVTLAHGDKRVYAVTFAELLALCIFVSHPLTVIVALHVCWCVERRNAHYQWLHLALCGTAKSR